jgi:signal transduction histidine kinase
VAAVARFAVTGLAALGLLTFVGIQILSRLGTSEAIDAAKDLARLGGRGIASPYITPQLLSEQPAAINRLDRVVRAQLLSDQVVRVKIWSASGQILYSDQRSLIGSRYPLGDDEREALRTGGVHAELSNLSRPENRFERKDKKLLEVYLGLRATDGRPVLFETYERFSSIAASGQRLWRTFFVPMIATMVLLELAQIPLALSLARRLRQRQREREELLRRAIEASELERKRIARDLHDGPVQDLAGVSYNLTATSEELRAEGNNGIAAILQGTSKQTRQSIRALRTLLVDIYPPRLHSEGLPAAVSDLLSAAAADGLEVQLDAAAELRLPPEAEAVLFRAAQEAIRNVLKHGQAQHLKVGIRSTGSTARLDVEDDGRGFEVQRQGTGGHFGLRMLSDLATNTDGALTVDSRPAQGTRIRLEIPLR